MVRRLKLKHNPGILNEIIAIILRLRKVQGVQGEGLYSVLTGPENKLLVNQTSKFLYFYCIKYTYIQHTLYV